VYDDVLARRGEGVNYQRHRGTSGVTQQKRVDLEGSTGLKNGTLKDSSGKGKRWGATK